MIFHYKVSLAFFFFLLSHVQIYVGLIRNSGSHLCQVDPEYRSRIPVIGLIRNSQNLCTRLFSSIPDQPDIDSEPGTRKNLEINFSKFFQIFGLNLDISKFLCFSQIFPNFWRFLENMWSLANKNGTMKSLEINLKYLGTRKIVGPKF